MKRIWRRLTIAVVGLAALALAGGIVWLSRPQPLLPEAEAALHSTEVVTFTQSDGGLSFVPVSPSLTSGLIFYPGGKVEPAAYAPAAAEIAAQGFAVFIVPMPLNLAVFGIDRAAEVQAAHPEIARWAVGGHSLGGAMAAEYAARNPGKVQGVLFWASYSSADLSGQPLQVVSIYGTLDAGRDTLTSAEARARLPADAVFLAIEGGNHEQFGYYTGQPNDPPAAVTREEQQAQAVVAAITLLEAISP